MQEIKKVDLTANILFSGIGCQERGIENSGLYNLKVLNTSEINKEAILSYAAIHCGLTPELIENYLDYPSIDDMIKELEDKNIGYVPPADNHPEGKKYNWHKYKKNNQKFIKKYWLAVHLSHNLGDISKIKSLPYADLWTVSFPCFVRGTVVKTSNGYKNIEDIKENELVLTHKGRYRKVLQTMSKYATDVKIVKTGISDCICCTDEHPFYARKKLNENLQEPEWVKAKDLNDEYYVGCPLQKETGKPKYTESNKLIKKCKTAIYNQSYKMIQEGKTVYKTTFVGLDQNDGKELYKIDEVLDNIVLEDDYVWVKVHSVYDKHYNDDVFNLEVEEDNSYVVQNVAVHNCQSISVAGKMKGFAPDSGTRSSLLWENIRLLKDAYDRNELPKYIMFENVKNLVSKQFYSDFCCLLDILNDLKFNSYWTIMNAKEAGIPQNRERVFVISIRKDLDNGMYKFPIPFDNGIRLKDVLLDDVDKKYFLNSTRSRELINQLIIDGKIEKETERGNF